LSAAAAWFLALMFLARGAPALLAVAVLPVASQGYPAYRAVWIDGWASACAAKGFPVRSRQGCLGLWGLNGQNPGLNDKLNDIFI
jgi:hypothetical protein